MCVLHFNVSNLQLNVFNFFPWSIAWVAWRIDFAAECLKFSIVRIKNDCCLPVLSSFYTICWVPIFWFCLVSIFRLYCVSIFLPCQSRWLPRLIFHVALQKTPSNLPYHLHYLVKTRTTYSPVYTQNHSHFNYQGHMQKFQQGKGGRPTYESHLLYTTHSITLHYTFYNLFISLHIWSTHTVDSDNPGESWLRHTFGTGMLIYYT